MTAQIQPFFDPDTYTYSYVVSDPQTSECAVIDPVLDLDLPSGSITTRSAGRLIDYIEVHNLRLAWILETHVHADHLTASQYIKRRLGGDIGIGASVNLVQQTFGPLFNTGPDFAADGSEFDRLFADSETFMLGEIECRVMATPGHTPACVTYVIDGAAFVGDTLFMPDYGTARTDFPGGDAAVLYDSIQKILSLPADTTLYMCHDYLPEGRREYVCRTTVADEIALNVHLAGADRDSFVAQRQARDSELAAPKLLLPSIQVNMRAGELPQPEDNEVRYLRIPLKVAAA